MARYEHLPIYKAALDMTVHFEKLVAGFSLHHKYTLGTALCESGRAVLQQVLRTDSSATCRAVAAPERMDGGGADVQVGVDGGRGHTTFA